MRTSGQHAEGLPQLAVQARGADLLLQDVVGLAQHVQALLGGFAADDPDRQARARERLAPDQPLGHAELFADRPDLVLEQRPQRLDQLEAQVAGETADVVVGLDRRRPGASSGLDHVRVEGALDEEAGLVAVTVLGQPPGLLLEHADELLADHLALGLGLDHALQLGQEALLGVNRHERDLEGVAEGADHLLALVLAHQAVIDEHARQAVADGAVDEQRGDR